MIDFNKAFVVATSDVQHARSMMNDIEQGPFIFAIVVDYSFSILYRQSNSTLISCKYLQHLRINPIDGIDNKEFNIHLINNIHYYLSMIYDMKIVELINKFETMEHESISYLSGGN